MKLPGFTAGASVGPTVQVYRARDPHGSPGAADVYPQLDGEDSEEGLLNGIDDEGAMEMADEEETQPGDEI